MNAGIAESAKRKISMTSSERAARLATRLSFLVAGFGIACWAPLVPYAKERLGVGDATLGLLLLCIGGCGEEQRGRSRRE